MFHERLEGDRLVFEQANPQLSKISYATSGILIMFGQFSDLPKIHGFHQGAASDFNVTAGVIVIRTNVHSFDYLKNFFHLLEEAIPSFASIKEKLEQKILPQHEHTSSDAAPAERAHTPTEEKTTDKEISVFKESFRFGDLIFEQENKLLSTSLSMISYSPHSKRLMMFGQFSAFPKLIAFSKGTFSDFEVDSISIKICCDTQSKEHLKEFFQVLEESIPSFVSIQEKLEQVMLTKPEHTRKAVGPAMSFAALLNPRDSESLDIDGYHIQSSEKKTENRDGSNSVSICELKTTDESAKVQAIYCKEECEHYKGRYEYEYHPGYEGTFSSSTFNAHITFSNPQLAEKFYTEVRKEIESSHRHLTGRELGHSRNAVGFRSKSVFQHAFDLLGESELCSFPVLKAFKSKISFIHLAEPKTKIEKQKEKERREKLWAERSSPQVFNPHDFFSDKTRADSTEPQSEEDEIDRDLYTP